MAWIKKGSAAPGQSQRPEGIWELLQRFLPFLLQLGVPVPGSAPNPQGCGFSGDPRGFFQPEQFQDSRREQRECREGGGGSPEASPLSAQGHLSPQGLSPSQPCGIGSCSSTRGCSRMLQELPKTPRTLQPRLPERFGLRRVSQSLFLYSSTVQISECCP